MLSTRKQKTSECPRNTRTAKNGYSYSYSYSMKWYSYSKIASGPDRVNVPTAIGLNSSDKNATGLALGGVSDVGEGMSCGV
jgi:hypothetical protein